MKRTLFDKIWDAHVVAEEAGRPAVLYIDLHLVHEVTSPQAFDGLRAAGRTVRRPELTVATMDHNVPTAGLEGNLLLKGLGPEPLANGFNAARLAEAFAGKVQNVKASLLDQRIVAGLGKI